ncbi:RND family efflux transporter MFP subunit [Salinisphaera sp. PC39]|uniref:efflux RND transporter periplasmic adaptor subunit n=1 Tax=Salinisphaera sp. PC39 TaxID=1304156 RepID=UPI00333FAF7A
MRVPALILAAATAALAAGCGESPPADRGTTVPATGLETVTLAPETVVDEVAFDGNLEALNRSTVASEVNARVTELPFDVGDYVEQGEVIARFRDTSQQARLRAAQAGLDEARARLAEVAETYRRARALYEKELIAKAQLENAVAAYESAKARVSAAEADVRGAQEALEHTVVRAPYSGVVLERHVELGETATVGQPLMTGLSLEHLRAVVDIPQSYIAALREHRSARAILPDGASVPAASLRIPPGADPQTHTFRVLVRLPEGDHGVFPGTLVKIAFVRGETRRLLLPATAVVRRSEVVAVYVVGEDGRVTLRQVRLDEPRADGRLPVLAGVSEGERVALDPIAAGIARAKQAAAR